MAKLYCAYCGNPIKLKGSRRIVLNNKVYRFCNNEEYELWRIEFDRVVEQKNNIIKFLFDLFDISDNKMVNVIKGDVNDICETYSADNVYEYVQGHVHKFDMIFKKKRFTSEYSKIKYCMAVIRNQMEQLYDPDVNKPEIDEDEELDEVEYYMAMNPNSGPTRLRRAMIDLEEEDEDDD